MAVRAAVRGSRAMNADARPRLLVRRSRVRLVRQTEVAECGLACLAMVANYHGLDIDLGTLRRRFQPSLRGASLRSLIGTADRIGFRQRAVKLPLEELGRPARAGHPALGHEPFRRAGAGERRQGADPQSGRPASRWYGIDELSDHFTGVALELRPADGFDRGESRRAAEARAALAPDHRAEARARPDRWC